MKQQAQHQHQRRRCSAGAAAAGLRAALLLLLLATPALAVRETKLYDALGIAPDADDRTLKKAYKKAALKWHPDRHADADDKAKKKAEDKFKDIAHAYETLSDPEKRQVYDRYGEAGLKQGPGSGNPGGPGGFGGGGFGNGDPFDMFNMFFGGGGGGGGGFNNFGGGGFPGGGRGPRMANPGPGAGGGGGRRPGSGGLYDSDFNVHNLDELQFPTGSDGWVWLVEYYAPWCGHCQQLTPKYKKVAASLKGVVKVAAVNCDQHKTLCAKRGVGGYPTIQALQPAGNTWVDYSGDRSASSLSNWATGLIGNAALAIKKEADLQALLAKCGGNASATKGASRSGNAAWGACFVLVSDKASMPTLWKALSVAYKGKAAFGFVAAGSAPASVLEALGGAPTNGSRVVSVCNGDLRTAEPFTGKTKSEVLQRHIGSYAAGKKCAAQVVLDAETDLAAMKVAQLKALITNKGIDCSGCFEKGDYVSAIKGWLQSQASGAAAAGGKEEL